MGSHIFDRQLRRSSVNARPRGATPSGVLSFLPCSQTLGAASPLAANSLFRSAPPGIASATVGLRPLSRDISSGFSGSLFFPSALFNSLAGGRFLRFGRSSGKYSQEAGPDGSGHRLTTDHRTAEAAMRPESETVAGAAPSPSPSDAFSGDFRKAYQRRARFPQGVRGDPEGPVRGRLYEGSPAWNPYLATMFRDERPGKR